MGFSNATLNAGANAMRATITHLQSHTGDPGSAGTANVGTAPRVAVSTTSATGSGDFGIGAPAAFEGAAPNEAFTHVSAWNGATAGTFAGSWPINPEDDLAYNAEGKYTLDSLTFDGQS